MKKLHLILVSMLAGILSAYADVGITSSTFPDANFRSFVSSYDTNHDSYLTNAELAQVTYMNVSNKNITNLTGVEYFTSLKTLKCEKNPLGFIFLYWNRALEDLNCQECQLSSGLDLSQNTKLENVDCSNNPQLPILSLNCANNLYSLNCGQTSITSLNLSNYTRLSDLSCDDCKLTSLNIAGCTALQSLYISGNQFTELNIFAMPMLTRVFAGSNLKLKTFSCNSNPKLERLDLRNCSALTSLTCNDNNLEYINVLTYGLSIYYCDALEVLQCQNNKFSSIKLDGNKMFSSNHLDQQNLKELWIGSNNYLHTAQICNYPNLEKIYVTNCPVLDTISCYTNPKLNLLYAYNNATLKEAHITRNANLQTLYLYSCPRLKTVDCSNNAITIADLSDCTSLYEVNFDNNNLNNIPGGTLTNAKKLSVKNNNLQGITFLGDYYTTRLEELYVDNNPLPQNFNFQGPSTLKKLSATNCTSAWNFTIFNNSALAELDISGCTSVSYLGCGYNALTSIRAANCPSLNNVYCFNNKLSGTAMSKLINDLPTIPANYNPGNLRALDTENEGNAFNNSHVVAAAAKRWNAQMIDGTPIGGSTVGDVNGDGRVNVSDVSALINMILGITTMDDASADVNGDGRVNVSDVSALINIILGIQ